MTDYYSVHHHNNDHHDMRRTLLALFAAAAAITVTSGVLWLASGVSEINAVKEAVADVNALRPDGDGAATTVTQTFPY